MGLAIRECKKVADDLNNEADSECCSICLDPLDHNRTIVTLRCNHKFHLDCIGSAFNAKGKMQCPYCRRIEPGQWRCATPGSNQGGANINPFSSTQLARGQQNRSGTNGRPNTPLANVYNRSVISRPNAPTYPWDPNMIPEVPMIQFGSLTLSNWIQSPDLVAPASHGHGQNVWERGETSTMGLTQHQQMERGTLSLMADLIINDGQENGDGESENGGGSGSGDEQS